MRRLAPSLVLFAAAACGPQGPLGVLPGGPLAGEVIGESVADWSFTDDDGRRGAKGGRS